MPGPSSCATAPRRRSGESNGSSRRTRASASCVTRTLGTTRPCNSPLSTESGCRCGSEPVGHPGLAVDGVLLLEGKLVTVIRGQAPFVGMHALPGGHVELDEGTEAAMVREFIEETGLQVEIERLVGVYSDPRRDPRGHTVSVAYSLRKIGGKLLAASDAAGVDLVDARRLPKMAFDHATIVADFLAGGQRFR